MKTSNISLLIWDISLCGVSSYSVGIQLGLHGGDVAPYRLLLLQLLTFEPQPVEQLLQWHVEPLPRSHLRVQLWPTTQTQAGYFFPSTFLHVQSETFPQLRSFCTPGCRSPHAESFAAQVVPAVPHVVQTSVEEDAVLGVRQRGQNPLAVFIQGVIQLLMTVNLCLEVLV